ncbi:metallophosphoesterase family protein [Coraliomargarita akajimensis]|uniref:Metallophosphoesterase n=1 Tax=Coraliomargarita akajimensis (strain DSM 45221 / IAM 15411 / JCM 23193 / KCTC 12865 / 04OKA010-24) TaxID=583355 RepID=D5EPB0_CORAD|nr:metallophosphoesterase [Coraliomargarita akajimensis]ADE55620.1 metallophosphoesterase [Coraliomargarita akajimensis DSM 45221]
MKLLLVADLHYTLPQWDWLDATAERFDIVVIAGDLLELNSIVPREAQIVVLRKYLQRIAKKVPLLVCSGNHDTLDSPQGKTAQWLQDKHDAKYWTDGEHYTADNLFFSILPWWESETDQIATERQLERDASQAMGKRWIWVYHPPPKGSPTAWNGKQDHGDPLLCQWIERFQPELVLGGHIHNAPYLADGSWIDLIGHTWCLNSGLQLGQVPSFTVWEIPDDRLVWISNEEVEECFLKAPLKRSSLL